MKKNTVLSLILLSLFYACSPKTSNNINLSGEWQFKIDSLDLGNDKEISGVKLFPRQDGITGGMIKTAKLYVSSDGKYWGKSVAQSTFSKDKKVKSVFCDKSVKARFIKFEALEGFEGQEFTSLAEFEIIQK